jgi:hypothetical protein
MYSMKNCNFFNAREDYQNKHLIHDKNNYKNIDKRKSLQRRNKFLNIANFLENIRRAGSDAGKFLSTRISLVRARHPFP